MRHFTLDNKTLKASPHNSRGFEEPAGQGTAVMMHSERVPQHYAGRRFLSQIAHARDSSSKLGSPLAYSRFSAS